VVAAMLLMPMFCCVTPSRDIYAVVAIVAIPRHKGVVRGARFIKQLFKPIPINDFLF
jgi:hypothetical protein